MLTELRGPNPGAASWSSSSSSSSRFSSWNRFAIGFRGRFGADASLVDGARRGCRRERDWAHSSRSHSIFELLYFLRVPSAYRTGEDAAGSTRALTAGSSCTSARTWRCAPSWCR